MSPEAWTFGPDSINTHAHDAYLTVVESYHAANHCFDNTLNCLHPMVLAAGKENNETYTFQQMLKQEDSADFVTAMLKEVQDH